jgi:RNA polymerase sigma-70 factor (ECF subfamily)
LTRWAGGRLPRWTRDLLDTDDLVQETVLGTVRRLPAFEPRRDGALQAYLRQAVLNRIANEVRRVRRRPPRAELPPQREDPGPSPLEEAVGHELFRRYEAALQRLKPADREAIVAKVELGCGYAELAEAIGSPSADAARMAISRALVRLAREMSDGR